MLLFYIFPPSVQTSVKNPEAVAISTMAHNSSNNTSMACISAISYVLASEWRRRLKAQNPKIISRQTPWNFTRISEFALVLPLNAAGDGIFLHLHVQFAVTEDSYIWNSSLTTYTHAEKIIIPFPPKRTECWSLTCNCKIRFRYWKLDATKCDWRP